MNIKDFFTRTKNDDPSVVFTEKKSMISAEHAYQHSTFGCLKTEKDLLDEFFNKAKDTIQLKSMRGEYCAIIEVCDDIVQYIPQIISKLTGEYGYKTTVLNDNCEIVNKQSGEKEMLTTGKTFIIMVWSKEAVRSVIEKKQLYVNEQNLNYTEEEKEDGMKS